jgi:hypothetical protein
MSTIPVPNGIIAEMIYTYSGTIMENVYWFQKTGPHTLSDLTTLAGQLRLWEQNTARTHRSATGCLTRIVCTSRHTLGAPTYEEPVDPNICGAIGAVGFPPHQTLACRHTTGLAGRSFRGRTYWISGNYTTQTSDGQVGATYASNVAAVYQTLRTQLAAAGFVFSVASLYSGVEYINGRRRGIPRASGILTPITATSVDRGIDTQRHRKPSF